MKAYIINLPEAKERRQLMEEQISTIKRERVDFIFFDAISWNEERFWRYRSHWDWDFFTKLYRGKVLSLGEKACFASHFALWEECKKSNQPILVFEDDVIFSDNFEQIISNLDEKLGFVRMMSYFKKASFFIGSGIEQTFEDICGTQGYFLTPKAASLFLKKAKIWFCPVDNYMDKTYLHGVRNLFLSPAAISENSKLQSCIHREEKKKIPFCYKISKELLTLLERIWRQSYAWKNRKK